MDHEETKKRWKARRQKIVKLHDEGKTWAEIGRKFCISRQRAQQLWILEVSKNDNNPK